MTPARPRIVNVVLPPGDDPRVNRLAIQAAIDSFDLGKPLSNNNRGGVVILPAASFMTDRPVHLGSLERLVDEFNARHADCKPKGAKP